jgi:hypothetical protein
MTYLGSILSRSTRMASQPEMKSLDPAINA